MVGSEGGEGVVAGRDEGGSSGKGGMKEGVGWGRECLLTVLITKRRRRR